MNDSFGSFIDSLLEDEPEVRVSSKERPTFPCGECAGTGRCSCCGRELTDPTRVAMGIGPICAEKWGF